MAAAKGFRIRPAPRRHLGLVSETSIEHRASRVEV